MNLILLLYSFAKFRMRLGWEKQPAAREEGYEDMFNAFASVENGRIVQDGCFVAERV